MSCTLLSKDNDWITRCLLVLAHYSIDTLPMKKNSEFSPPSLSTSKL